MISDRDIEYIENRLLAPSVAGTEAAERLRSIGQHVLSQEVVKAHANYLDTCREVRSRLRNVVNAERQRVRR